MQEKNKRRWELLFQAIKTKKLTQAANSEFNLNFISQISPEIFEIKISERGLSSEDNRNDTNQPIQVSENSKFENNPSGQVRIENDASHDKNEKQDLSRRGFLRLRLYPPKIEYGTEILTGFNNTGNVKIWSSEEALAKFCFQEVFRDNMRPRTGRSLNFLELGGGYSSMASLFLGKIFRQFGWSGTFYLTDGNDISVKHCEELIRVNDLQSICQSKVLRWGQPSTYVHDQLDYLLISDCFFFDDFRQPLKETLAHYLLHNPTLKIYLFAPSRNQTFQKFTDLFKSSTSGPPCPVPLVLSDDSRPSRGNCPTDASKIHQSDSDLSSSGVKIEIDMTATYNVSELRFWPPGQQEILFCEISNRDASQQVKN